MNPIMLARNGIALGTALAESGMFRPAGPGALARMRRALARHGANPAVLPALSAARWPNRPAIADESGVLTYRGLADYTTAVAGGLHADRGVRSGTAVAVMCRPSRYFVAGLFGALASGADVLLLNTDFSSAALGRSLATHEVGTIVCDAEFVPVLRAAGYRGAIVTGFGDPEPDTGSVEDWVRRRPAAPGKAAPGRLVILTSGTTGTPKGVPRMPNPLSVGGTAASVVHRTGLRTGTTIAIGIPMFHGFGLAMTLLGVALGAKLVLHRRFDAEATLAAVAEHRVEVFAGVPVMLQRILAIPPATRDHYDVTSLRVVMSGGAALSPALAEQFTAAFGEVVYNGYGSSEVGIGTLATPADRRVAPGTVGRPISGTVARILDDADHPVPPHVVGRIFVSGGLGFSGYSGGGNKTRVGNLISTGDLGYRDPAGRLFISGREDDMIVSGGENVFPQEVADVLAAHPDLVDVTVLGVDDTEFGQRLAAFAVAAADSGCTAEELREYLRDKVSRFQRPRDITLVTEIPRNPTGKVDRRALCEPRARHGPA